QNKRTFVVLVALAAAALSLATLTFTNVTYWLINATMPPVMKYAGPDAEAAATSPYVKVGYYYESSSGYNVTRISVIGFTGDLTTYGKVLRVCNTYGTTTFTASLNYVGIVSGPYNNYVKVFKVYWSDDPGQWVGFEGGSTQAGPVSIQIAPGQCATAGVAVLVDPSLPAEARDGKTVLATYQVNIVMQS
ncbi:MAG: hypothetical protein ACK4M3_03555, partial [Pyrobaculum sp.]